MDNSNSNISPFVVLLGGTILLSCLAAAVLLIYPIVVPTIVSYPWPQISQKEDRTVILAGSYNPPHRGHLAMLHYLSQRYTNVVAVVGFNPNKTYVVTPEARVRLLQEMIQSEYPKSKSKIDVQLVDGYIWRYAKGIGATRLVRGIRTWDKDGSDERALHILNTWGPLTLGPLVWPIPTMYLEGHPKYNHVSSTLIRDLCRGGGEVNTTALEKLVPSTVTQRVLQLYCPQKKNQ